MLGQRRPAQHRGRSTATSDLNPEVYHQPDGSLVATVNMRGTLFPQDSRFTHQASLSLLRLNHESGRLTKVGDYPFEGILPENASFDASSNYSRRSVRLLTSAPGGVDLARSPRAFPRPRATDQVIDVGGEPIK